MLYEASAAQEILDALLVLEAGDVLQIRTGEYVIPRLKLISAYYQDGLPEAPITVRAFPGERAELIGNTPGEVLLYLRSIQYWQFENLRFSSPGSEALLAQVHSDAPHNTLSGCELHHAAATGLSIYGSHTLISDCHLHHFDAGDQDAHGITIHPGCESVSVQGCLIHDCSGDGIQFIDEQNASPPEEYPADIQIVDNTFYCGKLPRSEQAIDIKAARDTLIAGNVIDGYLSSGIIVHHGTQNVYIVNNDIKNCRWGVYLQEKYDKEHTGTRIEHNIFSNISDYGIWIYSARDALLWNNQFNGVGADVRSEYDRRGKDIDVWIEDWKEDLPADAVERQSADIVIHWTREDGTRIQHVETVAFPDILDSVPDERLRRYAEKIILSETRIRLGIDEENE